tara:strand:+ start:1354 stop:1950 length:597 start_codon:yes stop_codon:yes gene_type:complete
MASEVGICSNALRKLGDDPITSLTDNSDRARLCNNLYAEARDELLQMRNWNFAIERVQLAALSDAPAFTWSYQYQLPGDCIRPIRLQYIDEDYIIEGRKILTDATTVNLIYLKQATDPNIFTPLFIQALEAKLASELAYPITGDLNVQTIWSQIADRKLSDAGYMDAMEQGTPAQVWSEDFINSRYANNGYTVDRRDL